MKHLLLLIACLLSLNLYAQSSEKFHQFSVGINMLNAVFKAAEINTEFMLNSHIGITCDLGNQFSTSAGKNLNLCNNKIEGYYGKIGPRLYFALHESKVTGYLSAGYIYSYFKHTASIDESDFYENFNITFSTQQKLNGTYIGIGTLVKMASGLSLDFGTDLNFYSPKDIKDMGDVFPPSSDSPTAEVRVTLTSLRNSPVKLRQLRVSIVSAQQIADTIGLDVAAPVPQRVLRGRLGPAVDSVDLLPSEHILHFQESDGFRIMLDAEEVYEYNVVFIAQWHDLGGQEIEESTSPAVVLRFPTHSREGLGRLRSMKAES